MPTTSPTLTPGQRIVWGPGKLPGTYNGPAETPGFASVTVDIGPCSYSVTIAADSLGPAE